MYILETNSFKYYLGERLLFKLPALKLHTKSRIGLIGLNGSGKTTLIRAILGILPPGGTVTEGKILFQGKNISRYKTNSCSRKNHLQNNNDYTTAIKRKTLQKRWRNDSSLHPAGAQTTIRFAAGRRTN